MVKARYKWTIIWRHNAQRLGVALRNLLKLPKAHKWVCFEFFYSNIDRYRKFFRIHFFKFLLLRIRKFSLKPDSIIIIINMKTSYV